MIKTNREPFFRRFGWLVVLAIAALTGRSAVAQQWYFEPAAELRAFYDDNVRLSATDSQSSPGTDLRAGLAAGRATEISDIAVTATIDSKWFADVSDFNRTNGNFRIQASRELERSRFGFDGLFSYDSTETSEEGTSGLLQVNKRRSRLLASPNWRYALTQRLDLDTVVSYETVSYEDVETIPLFNYTFGRGSTGLAYRFSERLQLFSNVSFARYEANAVDQSSDTYGFLVGAEYDVSETWNIRALGGVQYLRSEPPSDGGTGVDETTGGQFQIRVTKDLEIGQLFLQADQGFVPSGRGTLLETTALAMGLDYALAPRWKLKLDARAFHNSEPGGGESFNDRKFIRLGPRLAYQLTPSTEIDLGYLYRYQDREVLDQTATSNAVFLTLRYSGRRVGIEDALPF